MTSAQRLISYTNLPPEPSYDIDRHPPDRWPLSGIVEFRNVSLRYYEGGPQVLKEVNFRIGCHEKVGIAGRTGAGKTSIVSCLLRMPEATGDIMIDGVNIHHVTLQETRQAISVIQQNPVLFCRSIRENLDPFGMFSDAEIWNALHNSQLGTFVGNLNGKLDFQVKEGGANFSAGEMQLFCMARALLHKNKIIVMDEATANVDQNTDRLIQTTIREKFQDCTVLIIAHRLSTILDCDRIMVVDDGRVVEFDTPQNLTKKGDGWLSQLLQHS
ncbi:ATP-binding cassette sub-family C member 4-like [Nematostella vectensis]|nr:ATP-binding cassette sub-family C member 4-like [Nematostella vectensis]